MAQYHNGNLILLPPPKANPTRNKGLMWLDSDVLTSIFPLCGLIKWRNFEGILTVTVMHNEGYMIQHGIIVRIIVRFEINLSLLLSWMVMMKGWLVSWDQAFGDVPCVYCMCHVLPSLVLKKKDQLMSLDNHVIAGYIRMVFLATTSASSKRTSPPPEKNHPRQSKIPVCIARAPGLAAWKVGWDNVAPLWRRHANDDM